MLFEKKSVYHSKMVAQGQFKCFVKRNPLPSKYKKGTFYVPIVVEDGDEHELSMENEACTQAFEGMEGHWVLVSAEGRDADAFITVEDIGEGSAPGAARQNPKPQGNNQKGGKPAGRQQQQNSQQGKQQGRPPQQQQRQPDSKPLPPQITPKQHVARIAHTMLLGWQGGQYVTKQLEEQRGIKLTAEEQRMAASTITLQMFYDKFHYSVAHDKAPDIRDKKTATDQTTPAQ